MTRMPNNFRSHIPILSTLFGCRPQRADQHSSQPTPQPLRLPTPQQQTEEWRECADQSWRKSPHINIERKRELAARLKIQPNIDEGIYPFHNFKLSRADVEWLLAIHEDGYGPVYPDRLDHKNRMGLDLRGADFTSVGNNNINLEKLPLARTHASLEDHLFLKVSNIQREAAIAKMSKVNFNEADLREAILYGIDFRGATFHYTDLRKADLSRADLQGVQLFYAKLQNARLQASNLQHALLRFADMEGIRALNQVDLRMADLRDTKLHKAVLESADLRNALLCNADLQSADLTSTQLQGADLRSVTFDRATKLRDSILGNNVTDCACLADIQWGDTNVSVIRWTEIHRIGDTHVAYQAKDDAGKRKHKTVRLDEFRTAVRANRQVTVVLRNQGLDDDANRFAYQAQCLQRIALRYEIKMAEGMVFGVAVGLAIGSILSLIFSIGIGIALGIVISVAIGTAFAKDDIFRTRKDLGKTRSAFTVVGIRNIFKGMGKSFAWLFSWFLFLVSGYGYRSLWAFGWYAVTIFGFAVIYGTATYGGWGWPSSWTPVIQSIVESINAFHGRAITTLISTKITDNDGLLAWVGVEAVVGLIIEIVFIATLTRRFFGR